MDCLERDAPVETVVQMMYDAGSAPGLRDVIRAIRAQTRCHRAEIEPTGAVLRLAGDGALAIRYDRMGQELQRDVLTLSFASEAADLREGDEAQRLRRQSRLLQSIIGRLRPQEEHWHLLPGRLTAQDNRSLALSSAQLLSATRRFRRRAMPTAPPSGATHPPDKRLLIANDLPHLPAPRCSDAQRILRRLSCHAGAARGRSLVLRYSNSVETVLRLGFAA